MDDNKTFKSKTIELFGKQYEVKHKASNSINSKYWIIFGLIKHYFIKFYTKIFSPLIIKLGFYSTSDMWFLLGFIFMIYSLSCVLFVIISGFIVHDIEVNKCINDNCLISTEICKNNHPNHHRSCISENIPVIPIFVAQFHIFNYWCVYVATTIIFVFISIQILTYLIDKLCKFLCILYEKLFNQVKNFNDCIPQFEEV